MQIPHCIQQQTITKNFSAFQNCLRQVVNQKSCTNKAVLKTRVVVRCLIALSLPFYPICSISLSVIHEYLCNFLYLFYHFIVQELSEEERETILMSEDFRQFFDHTSRIVERALDETDIDIDYSKSAEGEGSDQ